MDLQRSGKSVVVVDDDRDIAEVVQTILLDEGFKVSCLYTPSQNDVKAAIDRIEPDVVLLDGGNLRPTARPGRSRAGFPRGRARSRQ